MREVRAEARRGRSEVRGMAVETGTPAATETDCSRSPAVSGLRVIIRNAKSVPHDYILAVQSLAVLPVGIVAAAIPERLCRMQRSKVLVVQPALGRVCPVQDT